MSSVMNLLPYDELVARSLPHRVGFLNLCLHLGFGRIHLDFGHDFFQHFFFAAPHEPAAEKPGPFLAVAHGVIGEGIDESEQYADADENIENGKELASSRVWREVPKADGRE